MVAHNPPRDNRCFRLRAAACRASGRQLEDVTCAVGSLGIDRPTCHEALTLLYERLLRDDSDGDRSLIIHADSGEGRMSERSKGLDREACGVAGARRCAGSWSRRHSPGSASARRRRARPTRARQVRPRPPRSTTTTTTTTPPPDFDGCTPGYWKSTQHHDEWTGFTPGQTLESVFDVPDSYGIDLKTLDQALGPPGSGALNGSGPDGVYQLLRHATAGILNANHPDVDYPFSAGDIVAAVNFVLGIQEPGSEQPAQGHSRERQRERAAR